MASLAFLRENNRNEEEEEEGIKTLRRENNKNEEEVEEEEDSIKTWRRENNTDLKLGWTVRWRTATGNKSCPIWV